MLSLFLSSFLLAASCCYCLGYSDVSVGLYCRRSWRTTVISNYSTKLLLPCKFTFTLALKKEKKGNEIERIFSKVSDFVVTPTEILLPTSSRTFVPLGYLLILGLLNVAVLPVLTSIFLDILFVLYFFFGRSIFDDNENLGEDDDNIYVAVTDIISLAGSLFTAGLISPQGFYRPDNSEISLVGVCCCTFLIACLILKAIPQLDSKKDKRLPKHEDEENPSRRLLQLWDEKFLEEKD